MKFGPHSLRFLAPVWTMFRRYLVFVGRTTTIHLQETALVIEGDRRLFTLPILDMFVQPALSERSMVTIPYSRILRHVHARYLAVKIITWLAVGGPLAFFWGAYLIFGFRTNGGSSEASELAVIIALITLLFIVVVALLLHLVFRSRNVVTFRGMDGRKQLVCFRFASSNRRRQFTELLRTNRDAARRLTRPLGELAAPGG